MDHRDLLLSTRTEDAPQDTVTQVGMDRSGFPSSSSLSFALLLFFALIKLTLLWIAVQLLVRYILLRTKASSGYSNGIANSRRRTKDLNRNLLSLRPIELEWRHIDEQLSLTRRDRDYDNEDDDEEEDDENWQDDEREGDKDENTISRTTLRQSPLSIQLTSSLPSIFTLPFRLFRISSGKNSSGVSTSTWSFRVLDLLARTSVFVTTAIMLFVTGSILIAACKIVWRAASGVVPEGSSEAGLKILIPGLSLPMTHLPLILITTLFSQFIHELFGHGLLGGIASLTASSSKSSIASLRTSKTRLLLPHKTGIFLSFPGIFAVAYVVFPPPYIIKRTHHFRTFHLAQMLAGGIFTNLISILALLAVFGSPTQLTAVNFFPSSAAVLLGIGPGAPAHVGSRAMPSLSLGKHLRALVYSADPLAAYVSTALDDGSRGLRVTMVDSSAPAALSASLKTGDVLTAIDDVQFTGQPFDRLDLWMKVLAPVHQSSNDSQASQERGWCYDKVDWDSLSLCDSNSTSTPEPRACFLPSKDQEQKARSVDPVALSEGKIGQFAGARCEVTDASACQATQPNASDGLCIIPDPSAHLVRLTLLSPNDGAATTTIFLQISHQALLSSLTLSPFIARAPLRALLPSAVTDGWLMLVELLTCYFLLVSFSIIVMNCLPLPGLDGNQMLDVFLDALFEKSRRNGSQGNLSSRDVESRVRRLRQPVGSILRRLILRTVQAIVVLSLIIVLIHNVF